MSKRLEGKIAVVTGASAGIGLGIAKRFAEEGARVFMTGRDQGILNKAVAEVGDQAVGIQADASKLGDIDALYAAVSAQGKRCSQAT
jgi:NAD(P)-dependent dehydrogenase (short-subunit alcohol dehydrogenase family)